MVYEIGKSVPDGWLSLDDLGIIHPDLAPFFMEAFFAAYNFTYNYKDLLYDREHLSLTVVYIYDADSKDLTKVIRRESTPNFYKEGEFGSLSKVIK